MSIDEPILIPITTIQPTFTNVIKEVYDGLIPSENIWVSQYHGTESTHARIRVSLDEEDRQKVVFEPNNAESKKLALGSSQSSYTVNNTTLLIPTQTYTHAEPPSRITALAVSDDRSQFAIGLLDGSGYLYPITPQSTSTPEKYLHPHTPTTQPQSLVDPSIPGNRKAHKSTINALTFFPSSRVLLSAGADFAIRVFPAEPPSPTPNPNTPNTTTTNTTTTAAHPARTLTAHTRPITSIAINPHDRGRTVLSASLDGSVRVWNVASGTEVTEKRVRHGGSGVVDMVLSNTETEKGKVYTAIQDGSFEVYTVDLVGEAGSRRVFKSTRSSAGPMSAIAVAVGEGVMAVGYASGLVSLYTIEGELETALEKPVVTFRRNTAAIEALSFLGGVEGAEVKLGIATADGLPWIAGITLGKEEEKEVEVRAYAELTGGEIDAVRDIVALGSPAEVWTVCDDGVVRRYVIP
ncbi:hypothetical protein VNI00_010553 [Paramarasmius palmivorus]|uniref:WD40 repeat-like protein n=1 Tax=Paramarasmius palmivorus TaxID=297713 RepID=A0AAW0CG12_9AGAR